jgi:Rieske Fe-S protein
VKEKVMSVETVSRQSVLRGFLATAVAGVAGFLVARGSDAAKSVGLAGANGRAPAYGGGKRLAAVNDVPRDGGLILAKDGVVLTRTSAGAVQGLSAICTHQGCTVSSISGGRIICPCHGSQFSVTNGAPVAGPATTPLSPVPVVVRGDAVFTR